MCWRIGAPFIGSKGPTTSRPIRENTISIQPLFVLWGQQIDHLWCLSQGKYLSWSPWVHLVSWDQPQPSCLQRYPLSPWVREECDLSGLESTRVVSRRLSAAVRVTISDTLLPATHTEIPIISMLSLKIPWSLYVISSFKLSNKVCNLNSIPHKESSPRGGLRGVTYLLLVNRCYFTS